MSTPARVGGAIHRVSPAATTNSISYTGTAGNALIVTVATAGAGTSASISDTQGNTWTNPYPFFSNTQGAQAVFYCLKLNSSAANTITITFGASTLSYAAVEEYSGLGLFDQVSTAHAGTSTSATTTSSGTPFVSGELAFAFVSTNTASIVTFSSWTNGFTQRDQSASNTPNFAIADLITGASAVSTGVTLSQTIGWNAIVLLFSPAGTVRQQDSASAAISGNGPGTVAATNACAPGDLLFVQFSLSNVSAGNAGFVPTITDNVNSGTYTVPYTFFASATVNGFGYMIANSSGTPTVTLAGSTVYSNGNLNYIRWIGFSATPTIDAAIAANSGNSTTPSGVFSTNGINELVAALSWGGNSYSTNPPGWNLVFNASGGALISPFWLEETTPATANFTGGVLSASEQWYTALAGFSSGPVAPTQGVNRQPGPGPSPNLGRTFQQRALNTAPLLASNGAVSGASFGGYGAGFGQSPVRAGSGVSFGGRALGAVYSAFVGRQVFRGPGPSPDWQTTFVPRALATYAPTINFGVTGGAAGATFGGFANPTQLGVGGALGGASFGGLANIVGQAGAAAVGGATFGGYAPYVIISGAGGVSFGGYASGIPIILYTLGQAIEILANAGFTVNPIIIWQYSTTVPWNYVTSQFPLGGTVISYQTVPVQLTVSAGPPPPVPVPVGVPNLTGLPLLMAIEVVRQATLNIGTINYVQAASPPPNTVTGQSPAAGTSVTQYSGVNLTVCSGPVLDPLIGDPYTVPQVAFPNEFIPPGFPFPPQPPLPPASTVPFVAGSALPAGSSNPSGSD